MGSTVLPFLGLGMAQDAAKRYNRSAYWTDWTDAGKQPSKVASSAFFIFFAVLGPAITFAVYLDRETESEIGAIEVLLSSGLCSILMAVLAGQPLTIVGVTGPISILTVIIYKLAKSWDMKFLPF